MKKIIIGIITFSLCLVIFVLVARNFIVKTAVTKAVTALTGLKVEIQKIDIGLWSSTLEINSLKVYNPVGFTDKIMVDIPLVYVDYSLGGFFKNRVQLNKIKIEIKELAVIINEQGKLNYNSLAMLMPKTGGGKSPEVKINELYLKIGKVWYKSYLRLAGTKQMEFNANIEETFKDVTNPSQLASDILKKILARVGISDLAKFDVSGVSKLSVGEAKDSLKNIFTQ